MAIKRNLGLNKKAHTIFTRTAWGPGPWENEPDSLEWLTQVGYPAMVIRNHMGVLNGYVGLSEKHSLYRVGYNDVKFPDLEVHGGITYAGEAGFQHRPDGLRNLWWVGFDTGHHKDFAPAYPADAIYTAQEMKNMGMTYRDLAYVRNETEYLAQQLKEWHERKRNR